MHIKMVNVYAIVREPIAIDGEYLSRFLEDVFEKKANAEDSLRDVTRGFAQEQYGENGGSPRVEIEFERAASKVVLYREECGQEISKEIRLRIEKIAVPEGRIEFVDGKAMVTNWSDALNKDPRFRDWDVEKWVLSFSEAHNGASEYSVEELRACCDWWKFIGVTERELNMPGFVTGCPWFVDQPECVQIHIGTDAWQMLLVEHPEFADRCTVWNSFDGGDWRCLLERRPEFADRCRWDKLNGSDWAGLLVEQPELSSYCQWNKLEGEDWVQLLKRHPGFADKCNWECLRGRDWCELLANVPELEKHLVVERLKDGTSGQCGGWLAGFLEKFPQHIPDCDLQELGDSWPRFLVSYPQYANQCNFKFDADGWGVLLPSRPEFVDRVDWSISWRKKYYGGFVLMDLLEKVPCVYEKCDWQKLRGDVLVDVLAQYPEVADKCNLGALTQADWYNLVLKSPAFGSKCPCWGEFTGARIGELLKENANLLEWVAVNELASEKLTDMLITAPELRKFVDFGKIDNDVDRMRLSVVCPELSEAIQGSDKWRGVKGYIWRSLSGPVVVVPVSDLIKKFPEYPVDTTKRVGDYRVCRGVVSYDRGEAANNNDMTYGDAQNVVDYIFNMLGCRAVAIDGVYVEVRDSAGIRNFAEIVRNWLAGHRTSIKLLYLEYGYLYDELALAGCNDPC